MKKNRFNRTLSHACRQVSGIFLAHRIVLISFSLPIIILLIAYAFREIFPFGKRCLLIIDLYHQYAPFLAGLREKILSFSSLQYSWTGGLGTNFLPLYAYYISSPLNILTVLFPKSYLTEAILVLVLIKIGLCGAFFTVYIKGVYKDKGLPVIAFSLMYSLSAYILGYSWNIMWLDCVYLLPLVILGLTNLVKGRSGLLFCISLALMLFSNFYAAYFGCLFIALYFPVLLARYNSLKKPLVLLTATGRFFGYSILSAGIVSALLIPTWKALKLASATGDIFPQTFLQYYRLLDYLPSHLTLAPPTVREGMPNIYCGIAILILIPIYFLSRNIRHKDKLLNAFLLLFLLASFNINILNFIWHGFHFPNQLPFRNSYVYIFLVLSIAYLGFKNIREFSGKQIGAVCGALILLIVIYQKISDPEMNLLIFIASIVFVMIYAAVLTLHKRPGFGSSITAMIFLALVVVEISTHAFVGIDTLDNEESYAGRNGYASGVEVGYIREAIDLIGSEDSSFYRMEIYPPRTTNDPYLYGFKGLSIFASTFREQTVKSIEDYGFHSNSINSYKYEGSTIVTDSLFGIKYLIRRSFEIDDRIRIKIYDLDSIDVYENPYALSLGFFAPSSAAGWFGTGSNPFILQNELIYNITGIDGVFDRISISEGENDNMIFDTFGTTYIKYRKTDADSEAVARINVDNTKNQQLYFYLKINPNKAQRGYVMIDDNKINFNAKRSTVVDLGYCSSDSVIEINLEFSENSSQTGSFEIKTYSLDQDSFVEAVNIIDGSSLIIDGYSDTKIEGHMIAPRNGIMIMTIPYDEGWRVTIDGIETETTAFDNAFLSFEISQGYHDIKLRFTADGFTEGSVITIISLLILAFIIIKKKRAGL